MSKIRCGGLCLYFRKKRSRAYGRKLMDVRVLMFSWKPSTAQRDASIEQQRDAAHDYAKTHGYHIIKETVNSLHRGSTPAS